MRENQIAEIRDLIHCVHIITANRCPGHVAARHHKAVRRHGQIIIVVKEQHLHRRVRQHNADLRIIRRHRRCEGALRLSLKQDDRFLMTVQYLFLRRADHTVTLHRIQITHHHGKRFCRTVLFIAQAGNRRLIVRVTAQMKAADPLDRHDLAFHDRASGRCDRVTAALGTAYQIHLRTAVIAADRLRIIASGLGMCVLPFTSRTHRKLSHTGALPVIRHRIQDRDARTAGCAVDKRVHVPAVIRIIELLLAFITSRDIRGDENSPRFLLALNNQKLFRVDRISIPHINFEDTGSLRSLGCQIMQKLIHLLLCSARKDLNIRAFIGHASDDAGRIRDAADKRPEADTLYNSINTDYMIHFLLLRVTFPHNRKLQNALL